MKFRIEIWTISQIKESYDKGQLNLNPPYQRRFIWSLSDQQTLIDSILRGYAIPNIFLFEKKKNEFEMVDGQQRTRTIIGFIDKQFKTKEGEFYDEQKHGSFFEKYQIPITIIEKLDEDESIEEFYALVNKSGIHLNRPELKKAEYFDTNFLKLVTDLSDNKDFQSLELFTDATTKRMNDIDFVSELVTYLIEGVSDKKLKVDKAFEKDITATDSKKYKTEFLKVISVFKEFNTRFSLKKTRYKQRNDFYTLFGFIRNNLALSTKTLLYFYDLLLKFNDDINPSNEKCEPFQLYAFHCISQSNSKNAREERAKIIDSLFLNSKSKANKNQKAVLKFYGLEETDLIQKENFTTFDVKKINNI
ncbi:MAG: DUF262 domain-containing protein [Bacteroidetes bacterium]|nr:DUF262 domain-containing protein [Bacteroidota bacterium]